MLAMDMKIDSAKVINKFNKSSNTLKKNLEDGVGEILLLGTAKAKLIAPMKSGALILAIVKKFLGKTVGVISSLQPNHPVTGTKYPYHVKMHTSNLVASRITSGDPHYMYTTKDYVEEIAPRIIEQRVKVSLKI